MKKFLRNEESLNARQKLLHTKKKREKTKTNSLQVVKGKKNSQNLMTNTRLTVPHMQTGIFLKGKSTVSYHRCKDTKLSALNNARMNEKLTEILNLAKNSKGAPTIIYDKENIIEDHTVNTSLEDINDAETLSSDSPPSTYINEKHKRKIQEKKNISLLSSEESSDDEKVPEHRKLLENILPKSMHLKKSHKQDSNNQEDTDYLDYKMFLMYFDNNVSLVETLTDFITMEKKDLKKKKRQKSITNSLTQFLLVNRKEDNENNFFEITNEEPKDKSFTNTSKPKCLNNIAKMPKRNPNYRLFEHSHRNHKKLTIITQSPGHPSYEDEENNVNAHELSQLTDSERWFKEFTKNAAEIPHSVKNTTHEHKSIQLPTPKLWFTDFSENSTKTKHTEENSIHGHKLSQLPNSESWLKEFSEKSVKIEHVHENSTNARKSTQLQAPDIWIKEFTRNANKDEHVKDYIEMKNSSNKQPQPEPLSLLNPLHFLEMTASQPEPSPSPLRTSRSDPLHDIQYLRKEVTASAFSAEPNLCGSYNNENPVQNFPACSFEDLTYKKDSEGATETFYNMFKTHQINKTLSPKQNYENYHKRYQKLILQDTKNIREKTHRHDETFKFSPEEKKSSQNVFILSPVCSQGSHIEESTSYSDGEEKIQMELRRNSLNDSFESKHSDNSLRCIQTGVLYSQNKDNLPSNIDDEECDIRKSNFWFRRKMY